MPNIHRGEIAALIDGEHKTLCLTLGALAELEARLQAGDLTGLADRFAVIAGQDTYGVRKPDPRHLTKTIAAAGGSLDRSIMVGDSHVDIDTAKAAKVRSVVVSFGYSALPVATLGANRIIDRFDSLFETADDLLSQG